VKLPRDISGRELAAALSRLGYEVSHHGGSHLRLATARGGEHHVTVPMHAPLKIGTLAAVLRSVGEHHGMHRDELLQALFG
jgi:predicted RNA binding protein YcfA (HicA-like mRNA interferase family)